MAEFHAMREILSRQRQVWQERYRVVVGFCDVGQTPLPEDEPIEIVEQCAEPAKQMTHLRLLAAVHRNRLGVVAHSNQCEAEIGLVTLLIEIDRNQRPTRDN